MKNPQVLEAIQRNLIQSHLLELGWMTYNPAADVGGVDWICIHQKSGELRKVQQKGRLLISKKYIGKDLWICCSNYNAVYMIPHDILLDTKAARKAQLTASWKKGEYHWPKISKEMEDEISNYKICDV